MTNLGYRVTTRTISYEQQVRESWGTDWGLRDIVYEPTSSAPRLDTDTTKSGVYGIPILTGLIVEPLIYADSPTRFMTELSQMIGID